MRIYLFSGHIRCSTSKSCLSIGIIWTGVSRFGDGWFNFIDKTDSQDKYKNIDTIKSFKPINIDYDFQKLNTKVNFMDVDPR